MKMKKKQVDRVIRDKVTGQFVFIHGINGQITRGTDWSTERNERELIKSERNTLKARKDYKDTNTINNTSVVNNSNAGANNIVVKK